MFPIGTRVKVIWTPCNIYSDERNLKSDYNYGFKILKIYNICPKNTYTKFDLTNKKKNLCKIRTRHPRIASLSLI